MQIENKDKVHNMASCMLSILDTLKLHDKGQLFEGDETLSEMMFRKMKAYNIDLNKELGFTHLCPVEKSEIEKSMPREITKEELNGFVDHHYLTVGRLEKFIKEHELAPDSIVVVQRVEDIYYENHKWGVYLKEGEDTYHCKSWNEDIRGEYLDAKRYPRLVGKELKPFTDEEIRKSMVQYHPIFSCVRYNDDKDVLFLDLHY